MKRSILIFLSLFMGIVVIFGYSKYDPNKKYSLIQLQEDLKILQTLEKENHTYYFTDKNNRDEIYKRQSRLLREGMTELEFYRVLSPILSSLNCGHTYMKLSSKLENYSNKQANYFPLTIKVLGDRAYVLGNNISEEIPIGSEIIAINGTATSELIRVFLNNVSSDGANITFKYFRINRDFNKLIFAYFYDTKEFTVKYVNSKDSKVMETKVAAVSYNKLIENAGSKQQVAEGKRPRLEINKEGNYAVLTVSSFDFYKDNDKMLFNKMIDNYFKMIKDSGVTNLIMDFRGNIGGAPYGAAHILTYLTKEPIQYFANTEVTASLKDLIEPMPLAEDRFTGNVYTLIDGGCFSTTGHICALLKYHKIGVFIGEETGGSFACSDGSGDAVLKNTKLIAHGSTQVYTTAVTGMPMGRGIMPDYPVVPTINDYIENKDIVKQFAIDLINK